MFWRNDYSNEETMNKYLESGDRTNYTYAESESYKSDAQNINSEQPKLFRYSIHPKHTESNVTNIITDCIMRSKSNSVTTTPRQKKSFVPNPNRILRSKVSNRDDGLVRELDIEYDDEERKSYDIGSLNTNSNNSGPEEIERTWPNKLVRNDYQLSADEDQGSDTAPTFTETSVKPKKSAQKRSTNQWFQKNMFGLPNDESDDIQPDFSGAISGDEQYDIASFENSNAFNKSKISKSRSKKSSKSDSSSKRSDSIICSPVAVLSYMIDYIWLLIVTTTRVIRQSGRYLASHSSSPRWYLMPLYLPKDMLSTFLYGCAYSIDRIFGTTRARKWLSSMIHTRQITLARLLLNWFWSLFLVATILIVMYFVMNHYDTDYPITEISSEILHSISGKECMVADSCCHSNWALWKRFGFCLVSRPTRFIISMTAPVSTEHEEPSSIIQSNASDLSDIVSHIQSRLAYQEELLKKYHSRISTVENHSSAKLSSEKMQVDKLSELTKDMAALNIQMGLLQAEWKRLSFEKSSFEGSFKNLKESHEESIRSVSAYVETLKQKLENEMKSMNSLIQKSDDSSEGRNKHTINLSNLLAKVQDSVSNLTSQFNEIYDRTSSLEVANEKMIGDSMVLKKEIFDEIDRGREEDKRNQAVILQRMNEQISKIEETLDKDYSKLLDREYLSKLIEAHLDNVESSIKTEINSTLWDNLKKHLHILLKEADTTANPLPSHSSLTSPSCQCPTFACRCPNSCVRVSRVRQMIRDALQMYSADKIGLTDFALETAGGTIATTRCTETYTDRAATLTIFGLPLLRLTNSPRTIIQPSINPGECWAMKGSRGSVVVQLSARVEVTAVTIDHIPKSISPSGSIDSAIKDFEIKALSDEADLIGQSLGNFTFQMDSVSVQTFPIEKPVTTNLVEMIVASNYGNEEYTCIYRLRVHGNLVKV